MNRSFHGGVRLRIVRTWQIPVKKRSDVIQHEQHGSFVDHDVNKVLRWTEGHNYRAPLPVSTTLTVRIRIFRSFARQQFCR
jgi:hypothetical protein